jgi:Uma2 family endonuclease
MATVTQTPFSEIEYPDSDGKPMSDNTLQFKWIVTIEQGVDTLFLDDPDVFVAGNLLWYPVQGNNKIRIGPDILVAFGRPKGYRGSYKQWEEGGIAPQVVFEILSPGNRPGEMRRKFVLYQRYRVEEYYLYNPDNGDLEGWRRRGDKLKKIGRMKGFVSPRMGIRLEPGPGPDTLTIIRPDGERFLTYQEIFEQRNAEQQVANEARRQLASEIEQRAEAERRAEEAERRRGAERERAEEAERRRGAERERAEEAERQRGAERRRAEEAEQARVDERERADRYAAKLRELGIEMD